MLKSAVTLPEYAAALREKIHSDERSEDWFDKAAVELFRLQYGSNAAYRRLCEAAKVDVASVKDWREIPAVPTVGFKELEVTSIPVS